MIRAIVLSILYLLLVFAGTAQDLKYYLPQDINYNSEIPTPYSVLGHNVGELHVSHDKLIRYMEVVAETSERVSLVKYGQTYENRPLLLLTITNAKNHANINQIREQHVQLCDPDRSGTMDLSRLPVVVWMGYSVHGNEASGANASLLAVYYLAAAQGAKIDSLLENAIILVDPSINPDGMNRFASWVNSHKSLNPDGNPSSLEHNEAWPGGRTNHYWFDLNRDWLPLQHPESKGRIAKFHYWKPNVLTDHHEMGSHRTFFFQPGVPSRNHPLSPENTFTLTKQIAKYHAEALDKIGSLYYSEEGYDDYYYGKGSTYPDINGAVGILFEQASVRGHYRDTENGPMSFAFAIRNQFTTTLSTLKAAQDLRVSLLEHQREFYRSALEEANSDNLKGYVFKSSDQGSLYHLVDILKRHQIDVYQVSQNINADGKTYVSGRSYIVPLKQPQYRLIKAIFESRTEFQDSLFYDVSAWTLPLAFNLEFSTLEGREFQQNQLGSPVDSLSFPQGQLMGGTSHYGYVFQCNQYYTYRAMHRLYKEGLRLKVATENMVLESGMVLPPGTVLVPVARQKLNSERIFELMQEIVNNDGVNVVSLSSGFSSRGKAWGSPTVKPLLQPKILVMAGEGVSGYESGEVWHLLDHRFHIDMSLISQGVFNGLDLRKYNTLVLVNGQYKSISNNAREKLKRWIEEGGQVIGWKNGAKWLSDVGISGVPFKKETTDTTSQLQYGLREKYSGAREIGGAIFEIDLDLTHPLAYGMENSSMPVFRDSEVFMQRSKNPFTNPGIYSSDPLIAGYVHQQKLEELKNTPAMSVSHLGKGRVISFTDNPNFRAFWYGTNRLFLNALFFGSTIESETLK